MRSTSLLAHLRDRFGVAQTENLATEALAYILNTYPLALTTASALFRTLRPDLPELTRVETQSGSVDDEAIPDLVGVTTDQRKALIVEAKFDASLTPHQPVTYLERISSDTEGLLVFLVPNRRIGIVWGEIKRRCAMAGRPVMNEGLRGLSGTCGSACVGVISWADLLNALEDGLRGVDDRTCLYDVRQLRGMCERADRDAFRPLSSSDTDSRVGQRMQEYATLMFDAVENQLVGRGHADIKGLMRSAGNGWFGRYLKLAGWECLLHVNFDRWARQRPTPVWLRISDKRAMGYSPLIEALHPLANEDPPRLLNPNSRAS